MVFPWQTQQWQQLLHLKNAKRLPHALLLVGIHGIGKAQFADNFSRAMLCQQMTLTNEPCNECHACRLIAGRTHPNVLWIEPEKAGQAIKVDQVRLVSEFINQSALQGEYRIVIIHPAGNMNINAANALLKTLEEPTPNSILILTCEQSERLPATVLSRCQRIAFSQPNAEQAREWLRRELKADASQADLLLTITNGAPLAALQLQQEDVLALRAALFQILIDLAKKELDPIKSAAKIQEYELLHIVDFVLSWLTDLLKLQLDAMDAIVNTDFKEALQTIKTHKQMSQLAKFATYLQQLRMQLCRGMNLNKQLVIENLLLKWMEC